MSGKPFEFERFDVGQRSGAAQPANVGNGGVRTQIEIDALSLDAPCPSLRLLNFDSLGSNKATFAKNKFQTVGRKSRLVNRDQAIDHFALALLHAGHVQGPGADAQSECRGMANELYGS